MRLQDIIYLTEYRCLTYDLGSTNTVKVGPKYLNYSTKRALTAPVQREEQLYVQVSSIQNATRVVRL